jgi:hypothetical protein
MAKQQPDSHTIGIYLRPRQRLLLNDTLKALQESEQLLIRVKSSSTIMGMLETLQDDGVGCLQETIDHIDKLSTSLFKVLAQT